MVSAKLTTLVFSKRLYFEKSYDDIVSVPEDSQKECILEKVMKLSFIFHQNEWTAYIRNH